MIPQCPHQTQARHTSVPDYLSRTHGTTRNCLCHQRQRVQIGARNQSAHHQRNLLASPADAPRPTWRPSPSPLKRRPISRISRRPAPARPHAWDFGGKRPVRPRSSVIKGGPTLSCSFAAAPSLGYATLTAASPTSKAHTPSPPILIQPRQSGCQPPRVYYPAPCTADQNVVWAGFAPPYPAVCLSKHDEPPKSPGPQTSHRRHRPTLYFCGLVVPLLRVRCVRAAAGFLEYQNSPVESRYGSG